MSLFTNLIASDIVENIEIRLKSNNGYLEKNSKSNLLAYIMIYYNDMKREVAISPKENKYHLTKLSMLLSEYKNYSIEYSYALLESCLLHSSSPIELFNSVKGST